MTRPTETIVMRGALVEVHFRLQHFHIGSGGDAVDSFSGIFEQVVVLKLAVPKPTSVYKRKQLEDGPYRPRPAPKPSGEPTSSACPPS
jgi:hypothetical protein